jgi:hypothetical protein
MISPASFMEVAASPAERFAARPHPPLELAARQCIEKGCSYAYYFRFIRFDARHGVLTVRGSLPSFYLKQVLISRLQHIDGLERIDDQVDVVSSTGLSSVRN